MNGCLRVAAFVALLGGVANAASTRYDRTEFLRDKFRKDLSDRGTGLPQTALRIGVAQIASNRSSAVSWPLVKAEMFSFVCSNVAVGVSEDDFFPAFSLCERSQRPITPVIRERIAEIDRTVCAEAAARAGVGNDRHYWDIRHDFDHAVPDWETAIKLGFPGLKARAEAFNSGGDFHRALVEAADAMLLLLSRLEAYAKSRQYAKAPRTAALIASLKNLREGPPRTVRDALLFQYLLFYCGEFIDSLQVRTLGNLDVLLLPYYRADLASGSITENEFRELLEDYWRQYGSMANWVGQPVYLGGTKPDGTTLYNEVSDILLDVHDRLAQTTPKVQLKMSASTPARIWRKGCDMARRHRSLVFCGENPMEKALFSMGFSADEVRNPDIWGCYEFQPRGCANTTLPSIQNVVMPLTDLIEQCENGQVSYPTFDAFKGAYLERLRRQTDEAREIVSAYEKYMDDFMPSLVHSLTIESCVQHGGSAIGTGMRHNLTVMLQCGLGSAVDSLLAVKELVYERRELSLPALSKILQQNWTGHEDLRLRMFRSRRKWGNHDPEADAIAREVVGAFGGCLNGRPNARGGKYFAGGHSIGYFRLFRKTPATPDGRHCGDEMSKNISPSPGADREGVTALVGSIGELDLSDIPGDIILDVALHPSSVLGEKGLETMRSIITVYHDSGGVAIQFNVFSPEELREAQRHPERYENLQVRLCGWNVHWNSLPKREQDAYILRAEEILKREAR